MKDNKLIAEFMGVVFHDDENQFYNTDGLYIGLELEYHKSWDWLMPVLEKIESIEESYDREHLAIKIGYSYDTSCSKNHNLNDGTWSGYMSLLRNGHTFITVIGNSRREAIYKTIVEFIKFYNNEKTN